MRLDFSLKRHQTCKLWLRLGQLNLRNLVVPTTASTARALVKQLARYCMIMTNQGEGAQEATAPSTRACADVTVIIMSWNSERHFGLLSLSLSLSLSRCLCRPDGGAKLMKPTG